MATATVAVEGLGKAVTNDGSETWTTVVGSPGGVSTGVTSTYVEGTGGMSYKVSNTTAGTACQTAANLNGEPYDFSSGGAREGEMIYVWLYPFFNYDTLANGGMRVYVVDDLATDAKAGWYVGPQPEYKGGWYCYCVDPSMPFDIIHAAGSNTWTTNGNPAQLNGVDGLGHGFKITATFGAAVNNCYADCISILKGYAVTGGDGADADATFASFISYESSQNIGATRSIGGGLFARCKIIIGGTAAENTTFTDSGFNVAWEPVYRSDGATAGVPADFYELILREGTGATNVTLSNGAFNCSAPHEVNVTLSGVTSCSLTTVSFTRARLISVDAAVTWTGGTISTSGLLTINGAATLSGLSFVDGTDSACVKATAPADLANVSNCTFTKGSGTNHAIEITGTAANVTLTNITFSGYAGSDGSTGNEAVFVNIASGSMNLTISGGTTPSVRTAGASVTVISGAVSVTGKAVTEDGSNVSGAILHLEATSGGPFPAGASVTITNSGTTATVAHTAHGMATNDKVVIRGASHAANIGVFSITVTGANEYTYTMGSAPGSDPTGTITSTFVVLNGTTNASGEVTMSRVFPSSQPVVGRIRKSSAAPYYKQATLTGTVSSSTGGTFTGVMISDD